MGSGQKSVSSSLWYTAIEYKFNLLNIRFNLFSCVSLLVTSIFNFYSWQWLRLSWTVSRAFTQTQDAFSLRQAPHTVLLWVLFTGSVSFPKRMAASVVTPITLLLLKNAYKTLLGPSLPPAPRKHLPQDPLSAHHRRILSLYNLQGTGLDTHWMLTYSCL
jgi:hypothetical protein